MSGKRRIRGLVLGLLVSVAGCWTHEQGLRPPPQPECYTLPPVDDSRFTAPIEYPRDTLNNDVIRKPKSDPMKSAQEMRSSMGAGPGSGY